MAEAELRPQEVGQAKLEEVKRNYDHKRWGRPSWRKLAEAAKKLDYDVYEEIVKKHMV